MLLLIGNIMKPESLKLLIDEKAVVRFLKTIGDGRYHTRELLNMLGEWGYGHKLLLKAYKLGLIDREKVKPEGKGNWRVYNKLAKRGKEVVRMAEEIADIQGDCLQYA